MLRWLFTENGYCFEKTNPFSEWHLKERGIKWEIIYYIIQMLGRVFIRGDVKKKKALLLMYTLFYKNNFIRTLLLQPGFRPDFKKK